ncbi:MAG: 30S ribosomal protein S9 [Solirubrobacteraceae bacterium]
MTDKKSDQGEVDEPEEIAAESSVGDQEQPTERQQEREQAIVDEPVAESEQRLADATQPTTAGSPSADDTPAEQVAATEAAEASAAPAAATEADEEEDDQPAVPRVKPEIPGMDLEPDIVLDADERAQYGDEGDEAPGEAEEDDAFSQPIADAAIDLGADARYRATGKRKTAVARVILRPGTGAYTVNGRTLDLFFPRATLQRTIRQPLETVGYDDRMDVIASMHGGGVSSQAGALRHGISRALLEADPNLRGELKRRGFLTRDARAKERKKAGLKKARKRPQFSKR